MFETVKNPVCLTTCPYNYYRPLGYIYHSHQRAQSNNLNLNWKRKSLSLFCTTYLLCLWLGIYHEYDTDIEPRTN